MIEWPEEFTLPEAKDFCKRSIQLNDGRCCTIGHFEKTITGVAAENVLPSQMYDEFFQAWSKAADNKGIAQSGGWISDRNDDPSTTPSQLAAAFRRAWEYLGYEIIE